MSLETPRSTGSHRSRHELRLRPYPLFAGVLMTAGGWLVLWSWPTPWSPLAFSALWTGAALVMWALSRPGYPSIRRHLALAGISQPLWWWFELVNTRVQNWEYIHGTSYGPVEYAVLSSLAFSTVVPAIVAAATLFGGFSPRACSSVVPSHRREAVALIGLATIAQVAVFLSPAHLFPLVWVAPFLITDGLVAWSGGRGITRDILHARWREPAMIGLAGLFCGMLWEFWNYWATPKWVYNIPFVEFGHVFEMPILGYGGYVPFSWSIIQLVRWLDGPRRRRSSITSQKAGLE